MHVKPLKHVNVLFTSIQMKGSLHFVFTTLIIILFVAYTSEGNHTLHVNKLTCTQQHMNTQTISIANYVRSMERVGTQMQTSYSGTAHSGTGNDSCYVLVECYSYLFPEDCTLCYTQARNLLRRCFPSTGGQIFLDGCFARFQNYNFYQEYAGPNDSVICGNATRSRVFQNSVRQAITNVVRDAPRNGDYFARQVALSDAANESVYVLANCWVTLDETSCTKCLDSAFGLILKCLPLSEGRALQTGCFIRYSDTNFFNPESAMAGIGGKTLAIVMVVTSIVAFLAAFYSWKHRSKRIKGSVDTKLLKILNSSSLSFKYSTIEKATNSFNEANKLGQGGFGTVYKGVLPDGKEVAVKRLFFNHRHRAKDFYYEVNIISSVNHRNLVKLVGFSCLGPESILVYEYLPNRSLDNFIFDPVKGKELDWAKRFDIIVGIAEGLAYLHENSKTKIIHRDIKAANILLDSRLRAKIADFGLARSFQQDKNHISTGIAGTLGYMAPEYISHGKLTEKVDVYSFGILLLEVATGMPNRGVQTSEYTHSLVSTAWKHFKKGSVEELFDPRLMFNNQTSSRIKEEIQSVIHIGLLCIQEVASLRPTMSMALQMLSKNIQPLPSPANPPYIPESSIQLNEFGPIHGINNPASVPTVSISSFIPR